MANFRNKSGFSLLEIIIAMGLATGILIFLLKMQGEAIKNAKTNSVNKEVETFTNDFKAIIDRPGFCDKSFEQTNLNENATATITQIKNPRGDIRYEVGKIYGTNSVKLNSITLKNFKPDDKEGLEGIATLELTLERIGKIYGAKTVTKTMEVSVTRNKSNRIMACGALGSGGITIQIAPEATTVTPPVTPKIVPQETTALPTPSPTIPASKSIKTQEEIMKELQNDPQFIEIQKAIKSMQKQNENESND